MVYSPALLGRGKFKGRSVQGIKLYNKLCSIVAEQRKDNSSDQLKDFETGLLERFKAAGAGYASRSMNVAGPQAVVVAVNFLSSIGDV